MEKVPEIFEKLEKDRQIVILYAVEAGSRAWGLESEDSDYDMRFVYIHNDFKKYLALNKPKECIDGFSEDRVYDWQGWDIQKALGLLRQMNPGIIEWIYSPIVYKMSKEIDFMSRARALVEEKRRYIPLMYHYKSMAKSNYKMHIADKDKVKIKKYLYVIRPAGMFYWIIKCQLNKKEGKLIEIDFNIVLQDLKEHIGQELFNCISDIIAKKKTLKEQDDEPRIALVDKWIDMVLDIAIEDHKNDSEDKHFDPEPFNQLIFDALKVE